MRGLLHTITERLKSAIPEKLFRGIFSHENVYALVLCLMLLAIIILTADKAPQWIYQGF